MKRFTPKDGTHDGSPLPLARDSKRALQVDRVAPLLA
jgi:hypothetical protein